MKLPELSIGRPVTTLMFFLGVVLLGFISLTRLPQELFPSVSYPQLTVVTSYENAAPEEVESLITKIIEETVGTVPNLKRLSSVSKEGISIVTAEFNWGTDMDFASLGVREKIDLIKERLPLGCSDPIVMKFNPFELPVITLSITGNKPSQELLRLSRKFIKDELEKVEGVASCNISGGLEREILVSIDEGRLFAGGVSITKVVDALKSSNINYPVGTIDEHFYEYLIRTMGEFKLVSEIEDTIVGKEGIEENPNLNIKAKEVELNRIPRLIYLKDIAEIKDTFQDKTSISRYNWEENISIAIQKHSGANIIQVSNKVKERLKKIKDELPKGIDVHIVYDQSIFIRQSIKSVTDAGIQGGALAFLVLLFSLKNIVASLVVAFSMPISIMVAFSLMYASGITLNMISMGGLALGIGMLVDAGIVVIENIYTYTQKGTKIKEASNIGSVEMTGAIVGTTLTTVAVFLPMVFVVGAAGQLFKEFSLTVTFSLLASLIIALSLIPCLTSLGGWAFKASGTKENTIVSKLIPIYTRLLEKVLRHKGLFLVIILIALILSLVLVRFIDKEFMPKVDQREFIIKINMLSGTKLSVTDSVVRKIEKELQGITSIDGVAVTIGSSKKKDYAQGLETMGSHQVQIIVTLKKGKKNLPTHSVIQILKDRLNKLELQGAEIEYILQESIFKTALQGSAPIVIEVKGNDLKKIVESANYVTDGIMNIEGIYGIRTSLSKPSPETKVNVLKDKAALYNLSTAVISEAAHIAIKGVSATKFKEEGREIDVRVRLRKEGRETLSRVRNVLIHSPLGIDVPLSEVAYITRGLGPSEIKRLDQQRVVLITANIANRALDKVIKDIDFLIEKIKEERLPSKDALNDPEKEITINLSGENQEMQESFKSLKFVLLLSLLLVYMIMASEFESLLQPFIIMFTVPLSIIGVILTLFLTHTPISSVVLLGVVILGGVVVDNGIVLIDCINRLRENGMELVSAVIEAGRTRLRPIFMTVMTTVLGLLPLSLGIGEGAELQSPMAITVMGGLLVSTILTLFVMPCIYIMVENIIHMTHRGQPVIVQKNLTVVLPQPVETKIETKPIPLPPPAPTLEIEVKNIAFLKLLSKRQKQLLEHLEKMGHVTRKEYADEFKISIPTAARDLKELVDKGILVAKGPMGHGRWYEPS